jgi:hypothetical protein
MASYIPEAKRLYSIKKRATLFLSNSKHFRKILCDKIDA